MKQILLFLLVIRSFTGFSQNTNSAECERLLKEAKAFEKKGDYLNAVKKYNSAEEECSESRKDEIDDHVLAVFQKIEAQRNKAIEQEKAIEREKIKVEQERDRARAAETEAKRQTHIAEETSRSNFNVSLALKTVRTNPTLALRIAEANYKLHPEESAAEATYYQILGDMSLRFYKKDYKLPAQVNCIAMHPQGTLAAAGLQNGQIILWSPQDLAPQHTINILSQQINGLHFSPDGRYLIVGGLNKRVLVWQVGDWESPIFEAQSEGGSILSVGFFPDNKRLYFTDEFGKVVIRSMEDKNYVLSFTHPENLYGETALSPDGAQLATADRNSAVIRIWATDSTETQTPVTLTGHNSLVQTMSFSPDGKQLLSGGYNGLIYQWDISKPDTPIASYTGDQNQLHCLAFHPDGNMFISSGNDRTIKLWQTGNPNPLYVYRGNHQAITSLKVSTASNGFWSGSSDGILTEWSFESRPRPLWWSEYTPSKQPITALYRTPDPHNILTVSSEGKLFLVNTSNGDIVNQATCKEPILATAISPDLSKLYTYGLDSLLNTWVIGSKDIQLTESNRFSGITRIGTSPSGNWIALLF
ncbi:MAG: hypothetical protein IPM98_04590 [Lewinellaceae bacterium]|nr:hypothetical protein [Lewinellaceae bacterium]